MIKLLTETSRGRKNTEERQMGPDEREVEMERIGNKEKEIEGKTERETGRERGCTRREEKESKIQRKRGERGKEGTR